MTQDTGFEQFIIEMNRLSNESFIDIKISPMAAFLITCHVQLACRHPNIEGDHITIVRGIIDQLIEQLDISPNFKQHLQKGWHPEFDIKEPKTSIEFSKEIAFEFFCDEFELKEEWESYFQCEATDNKIVISLYRLPELTFTLVLDEDGAPSRFDITLEVSVSASKIQEPLVANEIIKGKISIFPPDFREWLEEILLINSGVNEVHQEAKIGSLDNVAQDIPNRPGWMEINKRALLGLVFANSLMADSIANHTNQKGSFVNDNFNKMGFARVLKLTDAEVDNAIKSIVSSRQYVVKTKP